jgi:hypothetical protein
MIRLLSGSGVGKRRDGHTWRGFWRELPNKRRDLHLSFTGRESLAIENCSRATRIA